MTGSFRLETIVGLRTNMDPIKEFIDNLGEVAERPYAYVAYVCVVAAWTYIAISGLQLKSIQALKTGRSFKSTCREI